MRSQRSSMPDSFHPSCCSENRHPITTKYPRIIVKTSKPRNIADLTLADPDLTNWANGPLGIVILDPVRAQVVRATAARAACPAPTARGTSVIAARAQEQQDRRDEQGSPCAPAETESIGADGGRPSVREESVSGLYKGRPIIGKSQHYQSNDEGSWVCCFRFVDTYVIKDTAMV